MNDESIFIQLENDTKIQKKIISFHINKILERFTIVVFHLNLRLASRLPSSFHDVRSEISVLRLWPQSQTSKATFLLLMFIY